MAVMKIGEDGIVLIKKFEGLRIRSYRDTVGIWTVGFGHTGPDVHPNMEITEEEADALLKDDLSHAERCVNSKVSVALTQGEFDALCSFVFNLGCGKFAGSTLCRLINSGDPDGLAPQEFGKWIKAGGIELAGLVARREAELELFESTA